MAARASWRCWAAESTPNRSASGQLLDLGDEFRDAGGCVGDGLAEIAGDGGKGDPEEKEEGKRYGADQEDDGDAAAGRPVADADFLEALDDGHEHNGEKGADVEDFKLFHQVPGEGQREDDGKEEEDVPVYLLARFWGFDGGDRGLVGCLERGR